MSGKSEKIFFLVIISLFLYALLGLLTLFCLRWDKLIALGLIIYLVSIAAASDYFMPIPGQIGERFLLIPSLGWSIVLGALLFRIFRIQPDLKPEDWRKVPAGARYIFTGIMLIYCSITLARNFNWKDDLTLFRHDISYVNQSAQAHNLLALHLMQHSMEEVSDPVKQQEYWQRKLCCISNARTKFTQTFIMWLLIWEGFIH